MQVASQSALPPAPPDAYATDPVSSSRRKYQQQSPQSGEPRPDRSSTRSTTSPQPSSQRQSRQTSGQGPNLSSPETPHQGKFQSPGGSQLSNPNSARGQPMLNVTNPSPLASTPGTSPSYRQSRREQQLYQDYGEGPPIPPPPRTSSNQRAHNPSVIGNAPLADRTVPFQQAPGNQTFSPRDVDSNGAYNVGDPDEESSNGRLGGNGPGRITDDATTAAAAAARTRRRGPTSPETAVSVQGPGSQEQNAAPEIRSDYCDVAGPGKLNREQSEVINRVVVTDPQIDIEREQERQAEAVPVKYGAGLGLVGAEGVDDGGRGGGQSRQENSTSTTRRKETKFGEYILGQTLGEGEFGKVKLGWKKDGSVQVAIKLIRRESLGTNPSRLPKIYREISILRGLAHPNIVRLHEMVETDRNIGIILEYASGGELFDYILTHRYLKDNSARRLFAQLVSGVGYLHKKGIVHRDLKLENLLLDRNRNIIITDFGFANTFDPRDELSDEIEYNLTNRDFVKSRDLERIQKSGSRRGDLMQTSCGSPCYAAPELVVTDSLYTGRKVDVWSCGVILYAMLAGYLPFDDDPANPEGDNINLLYKYIVSTPLTFPEFVTPHARDLLRRILVPDPRKRADLFEVARHSWLSDYAHVVAHVTSSTTTVGEIANTTTAAGDLPEAPLLARSASVREPTKSPYTGNISPVGGLSHQGKIDPEQPSERTKAPRDPKRRTVQVEYVAPQSQTTRGEVMPSVGSPIAVSSPPSATTITSKARVGAASQSAVDSPRQGSAASMTKPLPRKPLNEQDPRSEKKYLAPLPSGRSQQRPISSHMNVAPPTRPARDVPRSVSDSTGAFGQISAPTARPITSGSIAAGTGRLSSRGNSYSQPLAPTVAVTNAQGSLAQPNNGKQYHISAPIPHPEPYISEPSIGRPSTQHMSMGHSTSSNAVPRETPRGHKRSNTLGNMFGKSGSFFGGRSQAQPPQESTKKLNEKRYPPTSMKQPIASDEAKRRPSTDSRRSSSFGIGRKSTDINRQDKSRRFSLLPASFSFKSFTGSINDQALDNPVPSQGQSSYPQQQAPPSRGQSRHQGMAFGRGQSRSNSYSTDNSVSTPYDGLRDNRRETSVQQPRKPNPVSRSAPPPQLTQPAQYSSPPFAALQEPFNPTRPLEPGQSYLLPESNAPTPSENSQGLAQRRPQYPTGFDSYDDEPRPSMQQNRSGRGTAVLQKNNRRFADAYDQEQEPGYGTGGHHAGSSGAAKRVMDFFRRRGKARSGDDR